MSRKRFVGGRTSWFGCALFVVVACGCDAMDPGGASDSETQQPSGSADFRARAAGSGGATARSGTGTGGVWGAPSGGKDGGTSIAPTPDGNGEASGGAGEEPEVLELPPGWT